jgi:hypothetical protein
MQTMARMSVFYSVPDVGYGALWVLAVAALAVLILTIALWYIESLLEVGAALVVFLVLAVSVVCVWWFTGAGHGG